MYSQQKTAQEALDMVQEKRKCANPNDGFLIQLKFFEFLIKKMAHSKLEDPSFKRAVLNEKLDLFRNLKVEEIRKYVKKPIG